MSTRACTLCLAALIASWLGAACNELSGSEKIIIAEDCCQDEEGGAVPMGGGAPMGGAAPMGGMAAGGMAPGGMGGN